MSVNIIENLLQNGGESAGNSGVGLGILGMIIGTLIGVKYNPYIHESKEYDRFVTKWAVGGGVVLGTIGIVLDIAAANVS